MGRANTCPVRGIIFRTITKSGLHSEDWLVWDRFWILGIGEMNNSPGGERKGEKQRKTSENSSPVGLGCPGLILTGHCRGA